MELHQSLIRGYRDSRESREIPQPDQHKMVDSTVDMTQVEALHVALQQSFSPDRSIRDPAEAAIKQFKFVPGAPQMLLHIIEEKQVR